jgi:hypothetical protein
VSKPAASRHFVALSSARLREWLAAELSGLDLLCGISESIAMERRAMSRSHRDNQRRRDRGAQRSYLDWYNAGYETGEPARYPYRRIARYGAPLRGYWAGVKVKRRRIERRRRERLDDLGV